MYVSRLIILGGLMVGYAGTPAMACPDNLAPGSNCVPTTAADREAAASSARNDEDKVKVERRRAAPT